MDRDTTTTTDGHAGALARAATTHLTRFYRHPGIIAAVVYLVCSLVLFRGLLGGLTTRSTYAGQGDPSAYAWYLSWVPHAILTGHNPLLTYAINVPTGANLMSNGSMPLAGLVMSPVTLTLGPLASLNLLFILGPVLTAITGRWWLSRHVSSELGRFVGGLAVGFGFFVTAHLGGHLNFGVLLLVPVMLRLAEDVVWRKTGPPRLVAAGWLGVATAGQALLSEEILAIVVVAAIAATLLAALNAPRTVLPVLPRALPGLGLAALTAGVLLAFPLYVQLYGPNSVNDVGYAPPYFATLRDLVVPPARFLVTPHTNDANLASRGINGSEDSVYVGAPMILLLVGAAIWWWRRWPLRVALLVAVFGFLLAMGSGVHPDGTAGWNRPGAVLLHLPILSSALPMRFGLITNLACAWVLAMVVGAAVEALRQRPTVSVSGTALALAAAAAVLVSQIPAPTALQTSAAVPSYFTSGAVKKLPEGTLVDLLPPPSDAGVKAMLYQAMARQRFRMLGSYARSMTKKPTAIHAYYSTYAYNDPLSLLVPGVAYAKYTGPASITDKKAAATRRTMRRMGVGAVIVVPADDPSGWYPKIATRVFGQPQIIGGVMLWMLH